MIRILILGCFLSFTASFACAQYVDNTVFRFLNMPVSARAAALGGNHAALFEADPLHFQLNPAALGSNTERALSVGYVNSWSDVNHAFVNSVFSLGEIGQLGVGIRYVGYGDLTRYDPTGVDEGSFRAYDIGLSAGLGRSVGTAFSYGVSLDVVGSSYDTYRASGIGLSGGFRYAEPEGNIAFGASFHHLGTQISSFNDEKEPMPADVRVGVSLKPEHVPIRLSFSLVGLNQWDQRVPSDTEASSLMANFSRHLLVGSEILFSENVHARLGYNQYAHVAYKSEDGFDFAGVSFGLGIRVRRVVFDFSRNGYGEVGGTYQIGVRTRI